MAVDEASECRNSFLQEIASDEVHLQPIVNKMMGGRQKLSCHFLCMHEEAVLRGGSNLVPAIERLAESERGEREREREKIRQRHDSSTNVSSSSGYKN